MNIDDVKNVPSLVPEKYLMAIFNRQKELMEKYKKIEGMPDWPFDLDNATHQVWLKDFLWRTVEELAESYEAYLEGDIVHTIEELADALHFATEFMILANVEPSNWVITIPTIFQVQPEQEEKPTTERIYFQACFIAGLVGNTLKNKKWKQSEMATDQEKFKKLTQVFYRKIVNCFFVYNCTPKDIYEYYFKKSEVNKFRQRTNY